MATPKPALLLLQLGDSTQLSIFDDFYAPIINQLAPVYSLTTANDLKTAHAHLSQPAQPFKAILIADGGFAGTTFQMRVLQKGVAKYVEAGGIAVFGCLFSSFVSGDAFQAMAHTMGLGWETGDYHRTTFALNPALRTVFGEQVSGSLEREYSMKALHLKKVEPGNKVYIPTSESRLESRVFPAAEVDQAQCAAAFQRLGRGYVGYIGDVNNESGSRVLVKAMLGTFSVYKAFYDSSSRLLRPLIGGTRGLLSQGVNTGASVNVGVNMPALVDGCVTCGKTTPVKRCARCRDPQYCSVVCQSAHWPEHKRYCTAPT